MIINDVKITIKDSLLEDLIKNCVILICPFVLRTYGLLNITRRTPWNGGFCGASTPQKLYSSFIVEEGGWMFFPRFSKWCN